MSENEQIVELEKDIDSECDGDCILPCTECTARHLFKIGYRKVERGEWIEHTEIGAMNNYWECSVCRWKTVSFTEMRHSVFCPNCGADMRGEGK